MNSPLRPSGASAGAQREGSRVSRSAAIADALVQKAARRERCVARAREELPAGRLVRHHLP